VSIEPYLQVLDLLPEPTLVVDGEGVVVAANPGAARLLGLEAGAVGGCRLSELLDDEGDAVARYLAACAGMREMVAGSFVVSRGDGAPIRCLCEGALLREGRPPEPSLLLIRLSRADDPAGRLALLNERVAELTGEVARRAQVEAALRESEARKTSILESSPDGIIGLDDRGRIVEFNPAAEQMFGRSRDEVIGLVMADLIIPAALRGQHAEGLERHLATGEGGGIGRRVETVALRADGTEFPVELAITRVPRDGPPMFTGFVRDLTGRRRAEEALRASEARLALAVEASQLGTFHCPMPLGKLVWNAKCKGHFGLPPDAEVTIETFYERLHPDDRARVRAVIDRTIAERGAYDIEYRAVAPDGRVRWLRALGHVFCDSQGTATRFDGVTLDVTDRKRAEQELHQAKEEAEAASRAKDHFLAVLSHELRTPLTPVLATVTSLRARDDLPADLVGLMGMIRRNVEMEARVIDDLLDLTRFGRGEVALERETLDVHESLGDVREIARAEAEAKRIDVVLVLEAAVHHVWADPARMQQVFWNLMNNAVKFTPAGGRVVVRTANPAPGALTVEVSDTGVGIDPDMLRRIFRPFEQAERTLRRRFGGLGLGLTISRRLVEMHGGTLVVSSAGTDRGATFTITLETVPAPGALPHFEGVPAVDGVATGPPAALRILLVEDHEDTRRAMSRLLRMQGHAVTAADTVRAALDLAAREVFDLLISDIGLPDGSGLELMRQLQQVRGIALSGFGTEDDLRRSREAGFAYHLTKPVNFRTLEQLIQGLSP
jgi:two-component system, chemotaxis family, CheB/CheR fusion protein